MSTVLERIDVRALNIPFRQAFAHASASRARGESVWVEARTRDGFSGYGEGCPRSYVTGETLDGALQWLGEIAEELKDTISDVPALAAWVRARRTEIDRNPSAWCAAELALLDAFARRNGKTVEAELGLPALSGSFTYTAVLGDSSPERFAAEIDRYLELGFRAFKLKLVGELERDRARVDWLRARGVAASAVRADANNAWKSADQALEYLDRLQYRFHALEEPIAAGDLDGLERIGRTFGAAIILDESLLRAGELDGLARAPELWIANLRVSKMGGLLRSLELVELLRGAGLKVVVGAHVGETSLLTRAALTVASAARECLVAQEGAFGTHLLAHDAVEPCLMFGKAGQLKAAALPSGEGGFGLRVALRREA